MIFVLILLLLLGMVSCGTTTPDMDHIYEQSIRRNTNPLRKAHSIRDFSSPNVIIIDSYLEMIKQLGYPDSIYAESVFDVNNHIYKDVVFQCYGGLGLKYFKHQDSIQLLTIIFAKSPESVIINDSLIFSKELTKSQLCRSLKIDKPRFVEFRPNEDDRFENDTLESVFFLRTHWRHASELMLYFNQDSKLYRIDFGYDNYGIL